MSKKKTKLSICKSIRIEEFLYGIRCILLVDWILCFVLILSIVHFVFLSKNCKIFFARQVCHNRLFTGKRLHVCVAHYTFSTTQCYKPGKIKIIKSYKTFTTLKHWQFLQYKPFVAMETLSKSLPMLKSLQALMVAIREVNYTKNTLPYTRD